MDPVRNTGHFVCRQHFEDALRQALKGALGGVLTAYQSEWPGAVWGLLSGDSLDFRDRHTT